MNDIKPMQKIAYELGLVKSKNGLSMLPARYLQDMMLMVSIVERLRSEYLMAAYQLSNAYDDNGCFERFCSTIDELGL